MYKSIVESLVWQVSMFHRLLHRSHSGTLARRDSAAYDISKPETSNERRSSYDRKRNNRPYVNRPEPTTLIAAPARTIRGRDQEIADDRDSSEKDDRSD